MPGAVKSKARKNTKKDEEVKKWTRKEVRQGFKRMNESGTSSLTHNEKISGRKKFVRFMRGGLTRGDGRRARAFLDAERMMKENDGAVTKFRDKFQQQQSQQSQPGSSGGSSRYEDAKSGGSSRMQSPSTSTRGFGAGSAGTSRQPSSSSRNTGKLIQERDLKYEEIGKKSMAPRIDEDRDDPRLIVPRDVGEDGARDENSALQSERKKSDRRTISPTPSESTSESSAVDEGGSDEDEFLDAVDDVRLAKKKKKKRQKKKSSTSSRKMNSSRKQGASPSREIDDEDETKTKDEKRKKTSIELSPASGSGREIAVIHADGGENGELPAPSPPTVQMMTVKTCCAESLEFEIRPFEVPVLPEPSLPLSDGNPISRKQSRETQTAIGVGKKRRHSGRRRSSMSFAAGRLLRALPFRYSLKGVSSAGDGVSLLAGIAVALVGLAATAFAISRGFELISGLPPCVIALNRRMTAGGAPPVLLPDLSIVAEVVEVVEVLHNMRKL